MKINYVVMDTSKVIEIGDLIMAKDHGGHHSSHKWYTYGNSLKRGEYAIVEDIDYDDVESTVLKVNNTAYRMEYSILASKKGHFNPDSDKIRGNDSLHKRALEKVRDIIYKEDDI